MQTKANWFVRANRCAPHKFINKFENVYLKLRYSNTYSHFRITLALFIIFSIDTKKNKFHGVARIVSFVGFLMSSSQM